MPAPIPHDHPLRALFVRLVEQRFLRDLDMRDPEVARYVADLLADFTHADNLFRIRNARGRRVEEVAELLIESNPRLEANSFDRERAVRKHIGDYTLFLTGLFPEAVQRLSRRRSWSLDSLLDYVRVGKESYAVVAAFDLFEYRHEAPLFRRLSDRFELCVYGLSRIKEDLVRLEHADVRRLRALFN